MATTTGRVPDQATYQGTEKLLWGIVLAVLTFWLFAGTAGTIAPAMMEGLSCPPACRPVHR